MRARNAGGGQQLATGTKQAPGWEVICRGLAGDQWKTLSWAGFCTQEPKRYPALRGLSRRKLAGSR